MPEAPVDEDREPAGAEDEVRPDPPGFAASVPSSQNQLPTPARPPFRAEEPRQDALGRGVAAPPDLRHQGAAFGAGVDVRHVVI